MTASYATVQSADAAAYFCYEKSYISSLHSAACAIANPIRTSRIDYITTVAYQGEVYSKLD